MYCAARKTSRGAGPLKKAVTAMIGSISRPMMLVITAIALRARRRSTTRMAGACSSWVRNGALARAPTIRFEAPR